MPTLHVVYLQASLDQAVKHLGHACRALGVRPWSLRGDPTLLQISPSAIAERFYLAKPLPSYEAQGAEEDIGTVAITCTDDHRIRVAFLNEGPTGTPVRGRAETQLIEFCLYFTHWVESSGVKAPEIPPPAVRALDSRETKPLLEAAKRP
jgi:hypothetical protein